MSSSPEVYLRSKIIYHEPTSEAASLGRNSSFFMLLCCFKVPEIEVIDALKSFLTDLEDKKLKEPEVQLLQ